MSFFSSTIDTNTITNTDSDVAADTPFWQIGTLFGIEIAWIIVAMTLLLCICCCCIACVVFYYRRRKTLPTKPSSASEHIEVAPNGLELHYKTTVSGQKVDRMEHVGQPQNDWHRTSQIEDNNFNRVLHDRSTSVTNNPLRRQQSPAVHGDIPHPAMSTMSYSSQQFSPLHAQAPPNPRPQSLPMHFHHNSGMQQQPMPMAMPMQQPMPMQQHLQQMPMQNVPSYSSNNPYQPYQQPPPQPQPHAYVQMAHSMPVQNFGFSPPHSSFPQSAFLPPHQEHLHEDEDEKHEDSPKSPDSPDPDDDDYYPDDQNQVEVQDTLTSIINAAKKKEKRNEMVSAVSSIELNRQPSDSTSF
eukprot:CAMPEP_0202690118 /NCGR_PEP_ID=MMETSP1385-20130828/5219_1 /ASSEMBLY_ACC=CAM_ASM_000861 /TAXON_ID=933848 /ORGANISM="Elphidium margaritaceum" /LENGTH=353 /DNA_ID=CAMNT_0049345347 /DNA_START=37 /DNA_END=1098 /DNA_ORIENTATION=+